MKYLIIILLTYFHLVAGRESNQETRLHGLSEVVDKAVAVLLGQRASNENGTYAQFKSYALKDVSNDEIGRSSPQEILIRSGYNYENHYVLAKDGYITQLIRIINPLVDRSKLRQPPVVMFHGGIIDPTNWLSASAIQHHPEKYPRTKEDGPITSSNRSLAFMLANNGYDVWLVGTRGCNRANQGHIKLKYSPIIGSKLFRDDIFEMDLIKYWRFSMDDIALNEHPKQIDRVIELTGAKNVSIVVFSLSTQISLGMLAMKPSYQRKVHNFACIAPILTNEDSSRVLRNFHQTLCQMLPDPVGTILFTEILTTQPVRDLILGFSESKLLRYTLVKTVLDAVWGPTAKWHGLLELPLLGHLLMPLGYRHLKHYCQQCSAGKLQRFDHGPVGNQIHYGRLTAPVHDLSSIHMNNWLLISAQNDIHSTPRGVQQLLTSIRKHPFRHVSVPDFNHVDLVSAFENDYYVNLPLLEFLNHFQLPPIESSIDSMDDKDEKWQRFVPTM